MCDKKFKGRGDWEFTESLVLGDSCELKRLLIAPTYIEIKTLDGEVLLDVDETMDLIKHLREHLKEFSNV